ncbi:MAG: phosphate ABC transporter substrate-binding/OmpA family protein [Myxococcota bacterium]
MHAIVLGWLIGCATESTTPDARPQTQSLKIAAAPSLMAGLLPALEDTHQRTRSSLSFDTTSASTAQALRSLLDGDVDLVAASREADLHEEEQARSAGWSFHDAAVRHVVGVDVIEVKAHPDNPIKALSYDEIIGIFCLGTVDEWEFVGGTPDAPMHVYAPPAPSGIRSSFEDFFCGTKGLHASVNDATVDRMRERLTDDPSAIAVVSASIEQGQAMGLRPDALAKPIRPTQQNLIAGAYPLRHDVIFFSAGPAAGYARSFLDWVKSPAGQEVVDQLDYLPLFLRPDSFDDPRPLRELVHFDEGQATPNARTQARIKLLIDEIRDRGLDQVVLEGFTDDREANPEALSEQRAKSVEKLLASQIEGLAFEVLARADKRPLAPNDTQEGRQRNRRVQVTLVSSTEEEPMANAERGE